MESFKNQTAFYHFRVWRGGDRKLIGQQLSIYEYQAFVNSRWCIHSFPGRRGTVLVLAENKEITRDECLKYAVLFMEGNLIEITIDLNTLERTERRISPPP